MSNIKEETKLIRINEYFNVDKEKFEQLGVLNSLINYDVPMFVNPKLLNSSKIEELTNSEKK